MPNGPDAFEMAQALAHLRETLRADLRLSNPRFDLVDSIED